MQSENTLSLAPPTFDGENYQMWAIKMEAYLEANDLWEAVEEDYAVPALPANPTVAQMKNHKENKQRKSKARAILFAAVSPAIFTRIMSFKSAKEIWDFLKVEYEGNEKIKGMKVMNLMREFELQKMKDVETVKEYADRLLMIVNQIRLLGQTFADSRIVQKILVTLPERYEAVISSIENSKDLAQLTMAELMNALQATEQRRTMRIEGNIEGALQAKVQLSQKSKMKKKKWQKGNQESKGESGTSKTFPPCQHCGKLGHPPHKCWKRPDIKCNKCYQLGHIARFCTEKNQQEQQAEAQANEQVEEHLFVAIGMAAREVDQTWLIDSGCTNHMTNNQDNFARLDQSTVSKVKVGNGDLIVVNGKGSMEVVTDSGIRTIDNILYVPEISCNLISVGQLLEEGYEVIFKTRFCTIKDKYGAELFKIEMKKKSFALKLQKAEEVNVAESYSTTELWHKRMGHVSHSRLLQMKEMHLAEGLPSLEKKLQDCKACHFGKQNRLPFPQSTWRAQAKLQLIHTDLAGPFPEPSLNGSRYYILFIDDFTRMSWIYFLKSKAEVKDTFWNFKQWVENQSRCKIQMIRSDNGSEYTSLNFSKLCTEAGIEHQLTAPYTPQQNGVCERKNRTVLEMARCLMHEKELPKEFWAEATNTAVFVLNRLPTKAVEGKTPFESWYGTKPTLTNLKVFGSLCYVHVPEAKRDKLDRRADVGVFIGYSNRSKAYRVYLPEAKKVCVSRDVKFEEEKQWSWIKSAQEQISREVKDRSITFQSDDIDDVPVRGTRPLSEMYAKCSVAMIEPVCYEEAKEHPEWLEAMQEELKMINKNQTWELTPRTQHQKVIGVKWVYKTKLNADGSVNKYKARLVAKGYAQVYGVDFTETFAPVARLDTIRLLLALAVQKGWVVFQLDVKSAFLNGYLEEEIFVEQPEGFQVKDREDEVYLLKKALYGLKQAPRAWNARIDQHLHNLGFKRSSSEHALYIRSSPTNVVIISLYVDDLLITGDDHEQIDQIKKAMMKQFDMSDLGKMSYFLGMEIIQRQESIILHQHKYAREILKKFKMMECKPVKTPSVQKQTLQKGDGSEANETYRSIVGSLMYLTNTRPDLVQAVGMLSRYLHCTGEEHMKAAKRVLRYVKGTMSYGLQLKKTSELSFYGYSDSDWAGSIEDMKSTSGYCFTLGSGMFSWCSKKQSVVAQSTAEAEFIAATAAANQVLWIRKLLMDLQESQGQSTKILVDNQSAIAIANNSVFHGKTKHFNVKLYFLREAQQEGSISLHYCKTEDQVADIFTKPLSVGRFEELRSKLGIINIDSRRSVEMD